MVSNRSLRCLILVQIILALLAAPAYALPSWFSIRDASIGFFVTPPHNEPIIRDNRYRLADAPAWSNGMEARYRLHVSSDMWFFDRLVIGTTLRGWGLNRGFSHRSVIGNGREAWRNADFSLHHFAWERELRVGVRIYKGLQIRYEGWKPAYNRSGYWNQIGLYYQFD